MHTEFLWRDPIQWPQRILEGNIEKNLSEQKMCVTEIVKNDTLFLQV
jgi:hypothetical protein